ncbi:hypothetical protein ACOME3_006601 [Neoechinorhynchus agilis]
MMKDQKGIYEQTSMDSTESSNGKPMAEGGRIQFASDTRGLPGNLCRIPTPFPRDLINKNVSTLCGQSVEVNERSDKSWLNPSTLDGTGCGTTLSSLLESTGGLTVDFNDDESDEYGPLWDRRRMSDRGVSCRNRSGQEASAVVDDGGFKIRVRRRRTDNREIFSEVQKRMQYRKVYGGLIDNVMDEHPNTQRRYLNTVSDTEFVRWGRQRVVRQSQL